jgi:hypothetical protein
MIQVKLREEIDYKGLVRLTTIGDGSCFFHAILQSQNQIYKDSDHVERQKLARALRNSLADILGQTDPATGLRYYDTLSRGKLEENYKAIQEAIKADRELTDISLEGLQRELRSSKGVGVIYHELVSELLDLDIYILDLATRDLYFEEDYELYYKGRNSVIVISTGGHYESVGIKRSDKITTFFQHSHPLIQTLHGRLVSIKQRK